MCSHKALKVSFYESTRAFETLHQLRFRPVLRFEQGPPPARAAEPNRIAQNRCDRQGGRTTANDEFERWQGGLYAPCEHPIRRITTRNSIVTSGDRFYLNGDFAYPRSDLRLALMEVRNGTYYLHRLLSIYRWDPHVIEWDVPADVRRGEYALGLVYRVEGPQRTRPVFERGSNTIRLRFE